MAKGAAIRAKVRKYYAFDRLSLEKAAKLADVAYTTAKRWKEQAADKGDDWDKLKNASAMSGGNIEQLSQQILTEMLVQFNAVLEMIKADKDMDAVTRVDLLSSLMDNIHKSMSAMRRFLPETNALAVGMHILTGMAAFVQSRYPQHGHAFAEILEPFGEELPRIVGELK